MKFNKNFLKKNDKLARKINTLTKNKQNLIFKTLKVNLNKNHLFLIWFFNNFKTKYFYLISKLIFSSKFLENINLNLFSLLSIKFKNLLFFQKWFILETFLIEQKFRFNLNFLINKNFIYLFKLNYLNVLLNFFVNFSKLNSFFFLSVKFKFNYLIITKIISSFFDKLSFIFFNYEVFKKNLLFFNTLRKKMKSIFIDIFLKIQNFDKFYIGFQAFINNNLYLARQTLFLSTIPTNSFNFLLLKNFNKIFFWIADKNKTYYLENFLFWDKQNILFSKGQPYFSYNKGSYRNNFIINSNYYQFDMQKQFLYFFKNKQFLYFFLKKNILLWKNYIIFHNKIFFQYFL
jgi:hypothetical protein